MTFTAYILIALSHVFFGIFSVNHRFNKIITCILYAIYGFLFLGICTLDIPIYINFIISYLIHLILYLILSDGTIRRIIFLLTTYSCIFTIMLGNLLALDAIIGFLPFIVKLLIMLVVFAICQFIIYKILIPKFNNYAYKIENGWIKLIITSFVFYLMLFLQSVFPYTFTKEEPLRIIIFEISSLAYVFSFILTFTSFQNEVDFLESLEETSHLKEIVKFDQLTNLFSRSYYEEYTNYLIDKQDYEPDSNTAVIVFDINDFKKINDTYGHLQGDEILKKVAQLIKQVFDDENDKSFRFGGDEFVVITQDLSQDDLNNKITWLNNLLNKDNLSVAAGYSFVNYDNIDAVQTAFKNADKAMYKEKMLK